MFDDLRPPTHVGLSHGRRQSDASSESEGLNGVQLWLLVAFAAITLIALLVLWGIIDAL